MTSTIAPPAPTVSTPTVSATPRNCGTLTAHHIEKPRARFNIIVKRGPGRTKVTRLARWETWGVHAETPEGALRVAEFYFPRRVQDSLRLLD